MSEQGYPWPMDEPLTTFEPDDGIVGADPNVLRYLLARLRRAEEERDVYHGLVDAWQAFAKGPWHPANAIKIQKAQSAMDEMQKKEGRR